MAVLRVATPALSESPAVQRQYLAQLALTAAIAQAIRNLWPAANPLTAEGRFREALVTVMEQFSQASASVTADFYRDIRTEAGVTGVPTLRLVPPPPQSKVNAGVDWALRTDTEAQVLARVEAAMQKVNADIIREQTKTAVEGDEFAIGYRRVPRPNACYFCITLALRKTHRVGRAANIRSGRDGADFDPNVEHYGVYKSRFAAGESDASAENRFHNNCHCVVEPVFFPVTSLPGWLHDMERLYDDSTANSKSGDRLNDFRRAISAGRRGETPPTPAAPTILAPAANAEQIKNLLNLFAA